MNKRQEEKKRVKTLKETFFLINWLGEEEADLYDVVPARDIIPSEESDVLEIKPGEICRVVYESKFYKAKVLKIGTNSEMRAFQVEIEKGKFSIMDLFDASKCTDIACKSVCDDATKSSETGTSPQTFDVHKGKALSPENPVEVKADQKSRKRKMVMDNCKETNKSNKKETLFKSDSGSTSDEEKESIKPIDLSCDVHKGKALSPENPVEAKTDQKSQKRKMVMGSRKEKNKSNKKEMLFKFDSGSNSDEEKESTEPIDLSLSEGSGVKNTYPKVPKSAVFDMQQEWQKKHITESGEDKECNEKSTSDLLKDLQKRMLNLEETTKKLTKKLKNQRKELEVLKLNPVLSTSLSASTSLCSTPSPSCRLDDYPDPYHSEVDPSTSKHKHVSVNLEETQICGITVDPLKLQSAKLHKDSGKCALQMLDSLFTTSELVNGNPSGFTNSKEEMRRKTIKKLDPLRIKYICDYVEEKWPGNSKMVLKKMTQKCTDLYNSRKDLRIVIKDD